MRVGHIELPVTHPLASEAPRAGHWFRDPDGHGWPLLDPRGDLTEPPSAADERLAGVGTVEA